MSVEQRRTKLVHTVIKTLAQEGKSQFRPGDVNEMLRARGQPLGTWEVRAELSRLQDNGVIELDSESATWSLVSARGAGNERKAAGRS